MKEEDALRSGLRLPLMIRREREWIGQAETAAAALIRGRTLFRRIGDQPGEFRVVDPATVVVRPDVGLAANVEGWTSAGRDTGRDATRCPLCELREVTDAERATALKVLARAKMEAA